MVVEQKELSAMYSELFTVYLVDGKENEVFYIVVGDS